MAEMLLLDVEKQEVREVEASNLDDYYKLLNCDTIDIISRRIVNVGKHNSMRAYDIICDDNGLLKENNTISALDFKTHNVGLVGNILICNFDSKGNEKSLSAFDKNFIKESIREVKFKINEEVKTLKVLCLWT